MHLKSPFMFPWITNFTCSLFFTKWAKDYIEIAVKTKDKNDLNSVFEHIYKEGDHYLELPRTLVHTFGWSWRVTKKFFHVRDVILPNNEFDNLKEDIEYFLKNRDWYEEVQIPYRRTYLLSGEPGSGKSTTVQAAATHFNLDVYALSLSEMTDDKFSDAISGIPDKSILLLEDIDCAVKIDESNRDTQNTKVTFSGLLNILDGVCSPEGRITFLTTNHRDKLNDAALLRPGRVDYEILYGYATKEQIFDLATKFKYDQAKKVSVLWSKENISMSEVQGRLITLTKEKNRL